MEKVNINSKSKHQDGEDAKHHELYEKLLK